MAPIMLICISIARLSLREDALSGHTCARSRRILNSRHVSPVDLSIFCFCLDICGGKFLPQPRPHLIGLPVRIPLCRLRTVKSHASGTLPPYKRAYYPTLAANLFPHTTTIPQAPFDLQPLRVVICQLLEYSSVQARNAFFSHLAPTLFWLNRV